MLKAKATRRSSSSSRRGSRSPERCTQLPFPLVSARPPSQPQAATAHCGPPPRAISPPPQSAPHAATKRLPSPVLQVAARAARYEEEIAQDNERRRRPPLTSYGPPTATSHRPPALLRHSSSASLKRGESWRGAEGAPAACWRRGPGDAPLVTPVCARAPSATQSRGEDRQAEEEAGPARPGRHPPAAQAVQEALLQRDGLVQRRRGRGGGALSPVREGREARRSGRAGQHGLACAQSVWRRPAARNVGGGGSDREKAWGGADSVGGARRAVVLCDSVDGHGRQRHEECYIGERAGGRRRVRKSGRLSL